MTKILKLSLPFCQGHVNALAIIPDSYEKRSLAIFSHGYTAHKGSVLSWALKLADNKMISIIFDLPGHYLGSFNEVDSFEDFRKYSADLFISATKILSKKVEFIPENIILGGHSLGGLLSIKALNDSYFSQFEKSQCVTVGVGLPKDKTKHVLEGPFFQSMLRQRSCLVSPSISPEIMFQWIGEEKAGINTKNQSIFLLTGLDDFISPPENIQNFADILIKNKNNVKVEIKKTLPHHLPEMASTHIKNFLKSQGFL